MTQSRVEATRWLIQEQDLWVCDKTAGDSESLLLATAETFLNGCAHDGVRLLLHTKAVEEIVNPLKALFLGDGPDERLVLSHREALQKPTVAGQAELQNSWSLVQ